MRLITLGDIHGNIEALKSVIEDAIKNYGNAIDGFIFLGDYVCDFVESEECIQLMLNLKEKYPVYAISGNRETGMAIPYIKTLDEGKNVSWDINSTMGAPLLSMERMSDSSKKYITSLDDSLILTFENADSIYLQHKMPLSDEVKKYLQDKGIKNILTAHTHENHINSYDGFELFNPGSVGITDAGIPGADYGVMTYRNNHWIMEKKHIDYNYEQQIKNCENNEELMKKCKNWGPALIASIKTGINVPALYMFEKNRIAKLHDENPNLKEFPLDEVSFGIGRYANVSPTNTHLKEDVILIGKDNSEIQELKFKTDEFNLKTNSSTNAEDWMYDVALNNVLGYLKKYNPNDLKGIVHSGRRFR